MLKKIVVCVMICLGITFSYGQNIKDCGLLIDYDGNSYHTVVIGNQCWMRENLRTTHYADGQALKLGTNVSETERFYYYPNNEQGQVKSYGLLYNWFTAINGAKATEENPSTVQGICPNGWHLPSNTEWMDLEDYVGYHNDYHCGTDVNNIARALASPEGWHKDFMTHGQPCCIVESLSANNATGMSVLPAGDYNGTYAGFGTDCGFWTASEGSDVSSPIHHYYYTNAVIEINCTPKEAAYSVRCVQN